MRSNDDKDNDKDNDRDFSRLFGFWDVSTNIDFKRESSCKLKRVIGYLCPAVWMLEMKEGDRRILAFRIANLNILYRGEIERRGRGW